MRHLTVVYTINDDDAFKPESDRIYGAFQSSAGLPYAITAISHGHEMNRVQLIEDATDRYRDDDTLRLAIDEIIRCVDPATWDWAKFDDA